MIVLGLPSLIFSFGCNKQDTLVFETTIFEDDYIDCFRRIGVKSGKTPYKFGSHIDTTVSEMGLDYTDKSIMLMHVELFDDVYIYDEYLNVYLYLYQKWSDNHESITISDLLEEYNNHSNDIMEKQLNTALC